jgi:radical SAM superfamily enzyme YgiQ (UPF0313 family)
MKIVLAALNSKYVHSNLAIRYIKAFSKEYDIELFEATINENLMNIAIKIALKNPDVVGFSCYIWNMEQTLKVCSILKEIDKDIKIVLGGPEVSFNGSHVLLQNSFIDYVIKGEGELTFKSLLDSLHKDMDLDKVEGLIFRNNSKLIENNSPCMIENLDIIPFPYAEDMPEKIIYYEASRGCPFGCKYCLSSTIKGVRFFSVDRVKKDLQYFTDKKVRLVKFVDRTFNANKSFAKEIWKYLIDNHIETKFHFEIAADILDEESIILLSKVPKDLFQFEIGIQSTNSKVLKNINRVMDFEKVRNNVLRIMENDNIHCHLDLIVGLPGESYESFKRSFDMVMEMRPDVLQIGFLKVLKGSEVFHESDKFGIGFVKYPPYHVLFTEDISFNQIESLLKFVEVFETYYNSKIFTSTMSYLLEKVDSSFEFFMNYKIFLEEKGFFSRSLDLKDKFKLLYDFSSDYDEQGIVKDILLHDFIITTKKTNIPDFLKKEITTAIRDEVHEQRNYIVSMLGEIDFKRILYSPVQVRIMKRDRKYEYIKEECILVVNLLNSEFTYIK